MILGKFVIQKPESLPPNSGIPIKINEMNFWMCNYEGSTHIFYDECSHMSGALKATSSNLVCTVHGWTYNFDGSNQNKSGPSLQRLRITNETQTDFEVMLPIKKFQESKVALNHPLQIQVHSHATLELTYREKSVLFDPWLTGSAYYGSWQLHPEPNVLAENLQVNAIVITHPHPDHFHLPTLKKINRETPIYFPKFPSGIIERGLDQLGFKNKNSVLWNDDFYVGNHIKMKFLRPRSLWEDSGVLTLIEDQGICFSWLNLVDAGSVIDQNLMGDLDLLTSAFDQGASGYPLTWSHISEQRKLKLLEVQKENTLEQLVRKSNQLKARYFMPFAGHWRLALPEHQKYAEMIPHTTFQELKDAFKKESVSTEFLGIYPGEKYDFFSGNITLLDRKSKDISVGNSIKGDVRILNRETLGLFIFQMKKLQSRGEAFGVEKVNFTVKSTDGFLKETFTFESSLSLESFPINVEVSVPSHILRLFAEGNANWDHIAIGYWGEWDRNPDIYPTNFMRLLQSGNNHSDYSAVEITEQKISLILKRSIGDLIESNLEQTSYFLTRLGLPCLSCNRSNSESLEQALSLHNIDLDSNMWILRELASTI
jgi:CMP-N-acetylneuraminate monooxygenase